MFPGSRVEDERGIEPAEARADDEDPGIAAVHAAAHGFDRRFPFLGRNLIELVDEDEGRRRIAHRRQRLGVDRG